jgi:hypothetical protein
MPAIGGGARERTQARQAPEPVGMAARNTAL